MNPWLLATLVLVAALTPCGIACAVVTPVAALAIVEVASTLTTVALMALSEGIERQPFIDLALVFAVMSVVGAIAFARLLEHDL
jgi:multisubunit Na+/H+ antiporter MnhF subunit